MRRQCNVDWGALKTQSWTRTLAIGTCNVTSLGGRTLSLRMLGGTGEVKLTSMHHMGSGTQLQEPSCPG